MGYNILFIVPKLSFADLSNKKSYCYAFPIGLGYILAVLKKGGHNVDCINLNHYDGKIEDLVTKALDKKDYDFVCTGHTGIGFLIVEKILNAIDKHSSKPKTIVGGPLISTEARFMAQNLKFDYGVRFEGEETVIELLNYLRDNKPLGEVKGLVYRDADKVIINESRPSIKNLDELPYPDFEAMGYREKLENVSSIDDLYGTTDYPRSYAIIGSRGCPFHCTFCFRTVGDLYRVRSIENIIGELSYAIDEFRINSFNLHDDLFSAKKSRLKEFCEAIKKLSKEKDVELKWVCSLWVSTMDDEILRSLKDAGCTCVGLGFESYSPIVLKSMKKNINPEQIDNALRLCMKYKMPIVGNFIFGDVAETKETAKVTLDYYKNYCKDQIKPFFIHPYPGSEIYNHCFEKGILKDKLDFFKTKIYRTFFLNMTDKMTDEEFNELKKEVYDIKIKYGKYIIPFRITKNPNKKKNYNAHVKCPYCNEVSLYKNLYFPSRSIYRVHIHCRNCGMRYHLVSRLYKFTVDHYLELDFLRKGYLIVRNKLKMGSL